MFSEEFRVNVQESTRIVRQATPVATSLSTRPSISTPLGNANERDGLSHPLFDSRNMIIHGGEFNHILGNLVVNFNQGSPPDSRSNSPPLNGIYNMTLSQFSDQSGHSENPTRREEVKTEKTQIQESRPNSPPLNKIHNMSISQFRDQTVDSENPTRKEEDENEKNRSRIQKTSSQKSNDIYERHLTLKGRGFPLWVPDPNQNLHLNYRRTGVRIGDVGIITDSGAFSFLFNICLPHSDPVNPSTLPEHFAPISPPIEAADIEKFVLFKNGYYLASDSIKKRSQTGTAISDIVFESSASEGAILIMPRGARSEDLGNLARFREYAAANVGHWYRYVNGPRGREAKNGDVRLVVGFDKTTSWGIASFPNQTQQNSCILKFGPLEGDSARWSEHSGVAEVKAGPGSDEIDELRIDSDPPDVIFENQCLFVRTLNVTLSDDAWADIHSSSDSQYPRAKNCSGSYRPHSNNPGNGSNFSPSRGESRLQGVNIVSEEDPPISASGSFESAAHPSKVLNDNLLAINPTAKMVITHDDDWSSVSEYNPHESVESILAFRDISQENDVVFLQPKKEIPEGLTLYRAQVPEADCGEEYVNEHTTRDDRDKQSVMKQWLSRNAFSSILPRKYRANESRLIPLTRSEEDSPLYAPILVQDSSVIDLPSQSDIIIAVMGPTGTGKSTFINKATGLEEAQVGHGLELCTHQIQLVRCLDKQNRRIVFVDTPGFDDTNISDLDTLQMVADWLKLIYEKDIHLSGLIYFHRISDSRMGGSPLKLLKMFHNLCGVEALKNVVLVTTMWDEVDEEEGDSRENELTNRYWKTMIELGCRTSRFENNTESALDIVSQFQDARCTVLLQKELVDLHFQLAETSAGRIFFSSLVEFIKKTKELLAQIEAKLRQNQNSANRTAVERDKERTVAALRIANAQWKRYSVSPSVFKRLSSSRRPSPSVKARQPLTPCYLPTTDVTSNPTSRSKLTQVEMLKEATNLVGPLTSSPIEYFPQPPSPADATQADPSKTQTVLQLQGTITALKLIQQIAGLAPVPGLQSLVGVVLNIAEVVNNTYTVEDDLVELAQKAGSFMVTLVEQGSIATFSDSDSMNLVIEGLTNEMKRALDVVNRISSQRSATRLLLSAFDKAAVDECNRQMALACGIFGIRIAFISPQTIARIEAKLNLALKIPQESNNKQTPITRRGRASSC